MKWKYKLVFDTGEIAFVVAKSREEAINVCCEAKDEEWVRKHARITNQGLAKSYHSLDERAGEINEMDSD